MGIVTIGGMGQMTPAMQQTIRKVSGGTARASGPKRSRGRKKKRAAPRAKKRTTKRTSGKKKRLVKGSAAAKAYMAKIRRKRKK